jgi:hypothetical protein
MKHISDFNTNIATSCSLNKEIESINDNCSELSEIQALAK